jgi:hypothetical protein
MGWLDACELLASGRISSRNFRRLLPVREVVETLAPCDGRHFAAWIRRNDRRWLEDRGIQQVDDWGDPIKAWSRILGTDRAFSPTTLRYLGHALWLKRRGYVRQGDVVVEIGVGFGGLAAANAIVSESKSVLIDLPPVCAAAALMMKENGLSSWLRDAGDFPSDYCLVSNYAFTELCRDIQQEYLEQYIRMAPRGVIVSNAAIFASGIGGRSDKELVDWLRNEGLPAVEDDGLDILSPADRACGVKLIHWNMEE